MGWRLLVATGLVTLSRCACDAPPTPPSPSSVRCQLQSGSVEGPPQVELGGGQSAFEPHRDGERWRGDRGPQGGQHVWLSLRTRGLGPEVTVRWEMRAQDGGAFRPWSQSPECLTAGEHDGEQEVVGVAARLGLGPPRCSPEVCGTEPFELHVKVFDKTGASASARKVVAGVDLPMDDPCQRDAGIPDGGDELCRALAHEFYADAGPF
ncbi:MAG: hypothetical protein AB2A00_41190 [Myxococcota bacterium]